MAMNLDEYHEGTVLVNTNDDYEFGRIGWAKTNLKLEAGVG